MGPSTDVTVALPSRPGQGTLGRPIRLRANHFSVDTTRLPVLALYAVSVRAPGSPGSAAQGGSAGRGGGGVAARDLPRRTCRSVVRSLCEREGWAAVAYDGASALFAPTGSLPVGSNGVTYAVPRPADVPGGPPSGGAPDNFQVDVTRAAMIDVSAAIAEHARHGGAMPAAALQALDAVMRHERAMDPQWLVAGSRFVDSRQRKLLGRGSELWLGYSQSARPTQGGTHLVVDRVGLAFIAPMSGVERLCAVLGKGGGTGQGEGGSAAAMPPLPLRPRDFKTASAAFKGVKVVLTHFPGQRRSKVSRGLSRQSAREIKFSDERQGGKRVSVAEYFATTYGVRLTWPDLPCVVAGSADKPLYFPLEVCTVPEQRQRLLSDARASSDMIRFMAVPPGERQRTIEGTVARHVAGPEALHQAAFGVRVANHMVRLDGRVLEPPLVTYKSGQSLRPSEGAWNLRGGHVLLQPPARPLARWALVTLDHTVPDSACQDLIGRLTAGMQRFGGITVQGSAFLHRVRRDEPPEDAVRQAARAGATFAVVLLPSSPENKSMYDAVKRAAEVEDLGLLTQCLVNTWRFDPQHEQQRQGQRQPHQQRQQRGRGQGRGRGGRGGGRAAGPQPPGGPSDQVVANLVQKINAKLGGRNAKVTLAAPDSHAPRALMQVPTLLCGADVSHAAPGSAASSIAAVVGSLDEHCARYVARLSAQSSRQEMIEDLEQMVHDIALAFYRANGGAGGAAPRPARVIFYRDGVSEGQFQTVLGEELPALRRAFSRLGDGSYNPPVTYVVAQKRHSTRLFCDDPRDGEGRGGSVPAGTVVDSTICHPSDFDFFLQSHAGIKGTPRPVHYHVLCDENAFGADALQALTFALTHLSCRCTRSVSLVPPVYYAHLAAARGAAYERAAAGEATRERGPREGAPDAPARTIALAPSLNDAMYFV